MFHFMPEHIFYFFFYELDGGAFQSLFSLQSNVIKCFQEVKTVD